MVKDFPDSCLYWIHLEGKHTDPFKEGYVGVSVKGAIKRFKNHQWHAKRGSSLKVHRAIRKYGDKLVCKTLVIGPPSYCLELERKLRPVADMKGTWNLGAGGGIPSTGRKLTEVQKKSISDRNSGRFCTDETKAKMSLAQTGRKWTEQTRLKIKTSGRKPHSDAAKQKMRDSWDKGRDWLHPRANKTVWVLAQRMAEYLYQNPQHGCERMVLSFSLPRATSPTLYKKLKSGWNPNEDTAYLSWLDQQKLELQDGT